MSQGASLAKKPSMVMKPSAPTKYSPEMEKHKYDLFLNTPKDRIISMSNAAGGELYEGEVSAKGQRHGKGTLRWPNGNAYFGNWVEGSMVGQGLFLYAAENDTYRGEFFDDKKHGKGRYEFANGNFYEGHFAKDRRDGKGRYSWTCGDSYDGDWVEGHMEGEGVTVYSNGNKYTGHFSNDRREGYGKLVCSDGLSYEGEWEKNMRHGTGTLKFPNGDYYVGKWENDKKHGKGKDVFSTGNVFEGDYRDNVKHGEGVMTYANGDVYKGEWRGDKMEGKGLYKFANGFVYDGDWVADVRHGKGSYTFPIGHVYIGEWKSDKRHGSGQLTLAPSGDVYKGSWSEGKMSGLFIVERRADYDPASAASSSISSSSSKSTMPLRKIYEGQWEAGVANKNGTYYFYTDAKSTQPALVLAGTWDTTSATKKSDGTVELPQMRHWEFIRLLANLSTEGKKPPNVLSGIDNLFRAAFFPPERNVVADVFGKKALELIGEAEMQSLREEIKEAQKLLEREVADFDKLLAAQARREGAKGDTAAAGSRSEALMEEIAGLKNSVAERKAKEEELNKQEGLLCEEIKRLQSQEAEAKNNAAALKKTNADRASKQKAREKLSQSISTLEAEIAALRTKLEQVEGTDLPKTIQETTSLREASETDASSKQTQKAKALEELRAEVKREEDDAKAIQKQIADKAAALRDRVRQFEQAKEKLDAAIVEANKKYQQLEKQNAKAIKDAEAAGRQTEKDAAALAAMLEMEQALIASQKEMSGAAQQHFQELENLSREESTLQTDLRGVELEVQALEKEKAKLGIANSCLETELKEAEAQAERARKSAEDSAAKQAQQRLAEESERRAALEHSADLLKARNAQLNDLRRQGLDLDTAISSLTSQIEAAGSSKKRTPARVTSPTPSSAAVQVGKIRRGSLITPTDSPVEAEEDADESASIEAELLRRIAKLTKQADDEEVEIERLLRERRGLEENIKNANAAAEGNKNKCLESSAKRTSTVDVAGAEREAAHHQYMKAKNTLDALQKERDKLELQIAANRETAREMEEDANQTVSIAKLITSLRPDEDWRLTYLAQQVEARGKVIQELELESGRIPLLEEQLQAHSQTMASLTKTSSSGVFRTGRPPPF